MLHKLSTSQLITQFNFILVTNNSSKQTTTKIRNLKAKQLSDFISSTSYEPVNVVTQSSSEVAPENNQLNVRALEGVSEIGEEPFVFVHENINELKLSQEGLQDIVESFYTFRDNSASETAEAVEESLEAADEEFAEEHHEDVPVTKVKQKKVVRDEKKSKSSKFVSAEMEAKSKQKSLAIQLKAYLDCCSQNGMLNRGFLTVINYRHKFKAQGTGVKINDVNLYNLLILGYAEKESLQKVKELINIIHEDQLTPNAQTFANVLQCYGRLWRNQSAMTRNHISSRDELTELINQTISEASTHNITVNDIFDKSIFLKDQREIALQTVHLVFPEFIPVYSRPELLYKSEIVDPLNENVKDLSFNQLKNLDEPQPGCEIMNSKKGFQRSELEDMAREQLEAEMRGYVSVRSIQKFPEPTAFVLHCREKLDELEKSWRDKIEMSFNRDFNTVRNQEFSKGRGSQNLIPYLRALETEDYTDIILREIKQLTEGSETFSPTLGQLYRALGYKVQLRYQLEHKKQNGVLQKTGEIYGNYCEILAAGTSSDNSRQSWQRLVYHKSSEGPSMDFREKSWPTASQIAVGRFLYGIILHDLKIDINCLKMGKQKTTNLTPAFYTLFRNHGRHVKEELKAHPTLMKLYRGSQQETLTFDVNDVPMVCPPKPWTSSRSGAFLLSKTDLIRLPKTSYQQLERIDNTPESNLYPALDSLNQLASVPWKVNQELLDVVLKIFNDGGDEKLDVPPLPSSAQMPFIPENESGLTKDQKLKAYRMKMAHRRKQADMYSLWCDSHYRLSLANHYRDRVFWLPHNMDFRGRVYPVPPHLNHLGSDLPRSLLVFHQKKKLGIDGFMWLKLHCINLTGIKKRDSIRERLLYAEEVMDEILDSAEKPLTGRMWWRQSEEPWQTLSCCMEIAKVLRSGDPENFESSYPIHQDGSCNGLQHYAALGRDTAGAISVNLAPADVPQDVYTEVATLVEKARQKDEEAGVEVARVLKNYIRRKVIKQTVMTTVYGVTRYGARLQIMRQLKNIEEFPQEYVWQASAYLSTKTFESLQEMFSSAKEIQDWFTDCAVLISSVCARNVEWVTPLGLPVVQPYSRFEKSKAALSKSSKVGETIAIDTFSMPNIVKQKNAFPPNFVHSLDSSHMMLTSLYCEKAGLTFISVHDCYWTHACTVPEMNKVCREQFVVLHSQPILEDLSRDMVKNYSFDQK